MTNPEQFLGMPIRYSPMVPPGQAVFINEGLLGGQGFGLGGFGVQAQTCVEPGRASDVTVEEIERAVGRVDRIAQPEPEPEYEDVWLSFPRSWFQHLLRELGWPWWKADRVQVRREKAVA